MVQLHLRLSIVSWLIGTALALGACGSSQPGSANTAGAASSTAATPAPATSTSSASTSSASPPGGGGSDPGHESALKGCAQDAAGDPARLSLCLAAHHVQIQPNGPLLTCLSTANDRSSVFACLNRYAR